MPRPPCREFALLALAALLAASAVAALGVGVEFPFDRAFGTYENIKVETVPAKDGAIDLSLSSPENTVTLESGTLRLEPAADGLHKATIEIGFSGEGLLITNVRVGAVPTRFEDRVRFPAQRNRVVAWVKIAEEEDGYRVVAEELPETVQIELESERAETLVDFCRKVSLFFAGDTACEGLESMLSSPRIPLPEPGSEYLVRRSALTEGEIERLDLYLAGSRL